MRSGEIWVQGSRRYANPASYLIAPEAWPAARDGTLEQTAKPAVFAERLASIDVDLERHLTELDTLLADSDGPVRLDEHGGLHLSPLAAEVVDCAVLAERDLLASRLPTVPLAELIIYVDAPTGFSTRLSHAAGASPRTPELEHRRNLYAAILAQACNFGVVHVRMAELTGISADTLAWTTQWYLREETLRAAITAIVNAHHRHPLARAWRGDPVVLRRAAHAHARQVLSAWALSRYFLDEGVTEYLGDPDQRRPQWCPLVKRSSTHWQGVELRPGRPVPS